MAIALALLTGLVLRFVGFTWPPYDGHAFRQTQTLATIDFFYKEGIDIFHPKTNYMGYPGVLVLELPIFQAFIALLYGLFGPHLEIIRFVNILLGTGTAWLLYCSIKRLLDQETAVLTALIYWLAPLNILYQRSTLVDPLAVLCGMVCFYYLPSLLGFYPSRAVQQTGPQQWFHFLLFALATWIAAMVKALYLWPSVLLFGWLMVKRRFKFDLQVARIMAVFGVAGFSFILWNSYAARVNAASPFTSGYLPTANLGMAALADPQYYFNMIIRRPKWWLGALGVLLYPLGLFAGWRQRRDLARTSAFLVLVLIPPTYLLLFSFVNRPHDYYQLVITPFLAVVPAYGLQWLAKRSWSGSTAHAAGRFAFAGLCGGIVLAAPLIYVLWYHGAKPDPLTLRFERLCAAKVVPGSSALLFVSNDCASPPPNAWLPEFLYAAHLWGFSSMVPNEARARAYFEDMFPKFPGLEYVILYGTERPNWLPSADFQLASEDTSHRLYIFRRVSHG